MLLTGAAAPAVGVQTEWVRGGQLIRSVPVQATVCRAMEEVYLSPKSGKVTKVFVKKGQHVREGELLFQLDVSEEEKALAAYRLGIRTIVIPKSNLKDLEEIPSEIVKDIKFIGAENIAEVFETALEK